MLVIVLKNCSNEIRSNEFRIRQELPVLSRLVFGRCYSMHSVNSASFGLPLPVQKVQALRNYSESILHLNFTLNLIQVELVHLLS